MVTHYSSCICLRQAKSGAVEKSRKVSCTHSSALFEKYPTTSGMPIKETRHVVDLVLNDYPTRVCRLVVGYLGTSQLDSHAVCLFAHFVLCLFA